MTTRELDNNNELAEIEKAQNRLTAEEMRDMAWEATIAETARCAASYAATIERWAEVATGIIERKLKTI